MVVLKPSTSDIAAQSDTLLDRAVKRHMEALQEAEASRLRRMPRRLAGSAQDRQPAHG